MKFSLGIADYHSKIDFKSLDHDELVQKIGTQLGAVEDVVDWSKKYHEIVVARVISCEKHPNADKLSVCRIDDGGLIQEVERGEDGLIQVVCGAPNVASEQIIAWIPPGATVPISIDNEPFVLEAREIRGVVSNGMIASGKELDINEDHEGIIVLNSQEFGSEIKIGEYLSDLLGLNDFIVDCENKMFTHRPDCFGNLGIAREIAGIYGKKFAEPEWYWKLPQFETPNKIEVEVSNNVAELVPRFMTVVMENVTIKPSPLWMQASLKRVGIKPINNVVDISNYVMHLTGQPTHAFDFDKLQNYSDKPSLFPRLSEQGEKIKLLGEKEVELNGEELVIATDTQAVALAGVMGGAQTEVDDSTKTIIIECATFDMYNIRRTSMRHGLFTEAVTRYTKGQSPLQNDRVLWYLIKLMSEQTGATQASNVYDLNYVPEDINKSQSLSGEILISSDFINQRLGTKLSNDEIINLLQNVNFTCNYSDENNSIIVSAPFWRMDIEIAEDLVEEVGRLYGYDKIPVVLPRRTSKPALINSHMEFKKKLRQELTSYGANEVLTYSFVHGDLMRNSGVNPDEWAYHIRNAISPELQYYRTSLIPSLLENIHQNIKQSAGDNNNEFVLYELGKAHIKNDMDEDEPEVPKQMRRLALVFAADEKSAKKYQGSAYYMAKKYLDLICDGQANYEPLDDFKYPISSVYLKGRSAKVSVNGKVIGVIGELNKKIKKVLKLPEYCAGFEIGTDLLQEALSEVKYQALSSFPNTQQDITLELDKKYSWQDVDNLIKAELEVAEQEHGYKYQLKPLDIFQPEDSHMKRFSFRVTLTHHEKTLKTEEVNKLLETIEKATHEKYQATRI